MPVTQQKSAWAYLNPLLIFQDLNAHRYLLWRFTVHQVRLRHKGSYLGMVWSVANPLLMMAIFTFIFGIVFHGRYNVIPNESGIDFALGIFLSLTIFQLVAEAMNNSPKIIVSNPNYVKKMVFPLEVLPTAIMGASLVHFFISLSMVFIGLWLCGHAMNVGDLFFPLIVIPVLLMSLGCAWFFSAIGVFFRDVSEITRLATMVLLYGSAVFYTTDALPPSFSAILQINPLLHAIEQSRNVLMWEKPAQLLPIAYLYVWGIFVFIVGYASFRKMKPAFADVI